MLREILSRTLRKTADLLDHPVAPTIVAAPAAIKEDDKTIVVQTVWTPDGAIHLDKPLVFNTETDGREWKAETKELGFRFIAYSNERRTLGSVIVEELNQMMDDIWIEQPYWGDHKIFSVDLAQHQLLRARIQGTVQVAH